MSVRISATMMVRNEGKRLAACLESMRGLIDELIIVDTGSTDDSVQIAEEYGARVIHSPWRSDFSYHRNEAFDAATGDWYLIIDGDEELAPGSVQAFRAAVEQVHPDDRIGCIVVPVETRGEGWAPKPPVVVGGACPSCGQVCGCPRCSSAGEASRAETFSAQRLIRARAPNGSPASAAGPAYRYAYPVHNQLIAQSGRGEILVGAGAIVSWYEGEMQRKAERSIPLLQALMATPEAEIWTRYGLQRPPHQPSVQAHASFFLAKTYAAINDHAQVAKWGAIAETHVGTAQHFAELWVWLTYAHLMLGIQAEKAGNQAVSRHHYHESDLSLRRGLALHPHYPGLHKANSTLTLLDWHRWSASPEGQSYARVSWAGIQHAQAIPEAMRILRLPIEWNQGGSR